MSDLSIQEVTAEGNPELAEFILLDSIEVSALHQVVDMLGLVNVGDPNAP